MLDGNSSTFNEFKIDSELKIKNLAAGRKLSLFISDHDRDQDRVYANSSILRKKLNPDDADDKLNDNFDITEHHQLDTYSYKFDRIWISK